MVFRLTVYCKKFVATWQQAFWSVTKGDRGEVAAAAWLGFSLDDVRKNGTDYNAESSNLSRAVKVHEFLKVVLPDMHFSEASVAALEGWEVNFTHFCRLGFTLDSSILQRCWEQRAALYLPEGEEGIDLLITVKNTETSTFATLRVQVKNYKNKITDSTAGDLLDKLDVRRCAPHTLLLKDEPFSIALLIQVGEGYMENTSELAPLGRRTPSTSSNTSVAQQLRLACTVSGQYASDSCRENVYAVVQLYRLQAGVKSRKIVEATFTCQVDRHVGRYGREDWALVPDENKSVVLKRVNPFSQDMQDNDEIMAWRLRGNRNRDCKLTPLDYARSKML